MQIATKFEQLVGERDTDGMTGLQLLSCNPGAFQREDEMSFFKKIVNSGWYNQSFLSYRSYINVFFFFMGSLKCIRLIIYTIFYIEF